jgi:hypothetical protein
MPSQEIPSQSFSVTAVSYGDISVSPNPGYNVNNLYAGLIGYIVGPGGNPSSQRIVIVAVVSAGVIRCRVAPFEGTGGTGTQFNFAAFNGGTINFEAQVATVASLYLDAGQIAGGMLTGTYPNPSVIPATANAPGAMPAGLSIPLVVTISFDHVAFLEAGVSAQILVGSLTARQKLMAIVMEPVVAFVGAGLTAVSATVGGGTSGNESIYLDSLNVMQTDATRSNGGIFSGRDLAVADTNGDIVLTVTGNTAFGNGSETILTAGKLWITMYVSTLPEGA